MLHGSMFETGNNNIETATSLIIKYAGDLGFNSLRLTAILKKLTTLYFAYVRQCVHEIMYMCTCV